MFIAADAFSAFQVTFNKLTEGFILISDFFTLLFQRKKQILHFFGLLKIQIKLPDIFFRSQILTYSGFCWRPFEFLLQETVSYFPFFFFSADLQICLIYRCFCYF